MTTNIGDGGVKDLKVSSAANGAAEEYKTETLEDGTKVFIDPATGEILSKSY